MTHPNWTELLEFRTSAGKPITIPVFGVSMAPMIRTGDTVTIQPCSADQLKIGDVIAYIQEQTVIVHRLVKIKLSEGKRLLCQKGDNLTGWGWLTEDQLIGKAVYIQRSDTIADMNTPVWMLVNRMMGQLGGLLITLAEYSGPVVKRIYPKYSDLKMKGFPLVNRLLQQLIP